MLSPPSLKLNAWTENLNLLPEPWWTAYVGSLGQLNKRIWKDEWEFNIFKDNISIYYCWWRPPSRLWYKVDDLPKVDICDIWIHAEIRTAQSVNYRWFHSKQFKKGRATLKTYPSLEEHQNDAVSNNVVGKFDRRRWNINMCLMEKELSPYLLMWLLT